MDTRPSEQQLQALADAMPQLAWMARPDGSISWFNRHWHYFSATTSEQTASADWNSLLHPDHVVRVLTGYRHAIATGEPWQDTFPLRDGQGVYHWFKTCAVPLRDAEGRIECWFGTNTDITEQIEFAERLRESEARFRALVDASPLGIVVMDMKGEPIYFNPTCEMLHGIGLDAAFGDGWAQAVHPEDRERIFNSWRAAVESAQPWAQTYRFLHADGRAVWVSGRTAPMSVGGRQVGFVGTLEDITELKDAERDRERLLQQEQDARCRAQRSTQLRDEMLGIVAHDLRNPLQTLAVLASQMLKTPEPRSPSTVNGAQLIQQTVGNMDRLIRDLLDVSTIETGGLVMQPEQLEIGLLLEEIVRLFDGPAMEKGITLRFKHADRMLHVFADRTRLIQVLSNLVGNAVKFTPAGGNVWLDARANELGIDVSVTDTGPGIPADELSQVFDRFWQARRAARAGAGLGLAISKGIIEAHGGRIWATSEPGHGATLFFSLPYPQVSHT